jgi:hypothetical protein
MHTAAEGLRQRGDQAIEGLGPAIDVVMAGDVAVREGWPDAAKFAAGRVRALVRMGAEQPARAALGQARAILSKEEHHLLEAQIAERDGRSQSQGAFALVMASRGGDRKGLAAAVRAAVLDTQSPLADRLFCLRVAAQFERGRGDFTAAANHQGTVVALSNDPVDRSRHRYQLACDVFAAGHRDRAHALWRELAADETAWGSAAWEHLGLEQRQRTKDGVVRCDAAL